MDILRKNVPHLVPSEKKMKGWFDFDEEEMSVWEDVCGEGMLLGLLLPLVAVGGWC
jgi:hypothetical protein